MNDDIPTGRIWLEIHPNLWFMPDMRIQGSLRTITSHDDNDEAVYNVTYETYPDTLQVDSSEVGLLARCLRWLFYHSHVFRWIVDRMGRMLMAL